LGLLAVGIDGLEAAAAVLAAGNERGLGLGHELARPVEDVGDPRGRGYALVAREELLAGMDRIGDAADLDPALGDHDAELIAVGLDGKFGTVGADFALGSLDNEGRSVRLLGPRLDLDKDGAAKELG